MSSATSFGAAASIFRTSPTWVSSGAGRFLAVSDSSYFAAASQKACGSFGRLVDVAPTLLEAARFDPASIRRTSTRLHLRSEASSRFERGLSAELPLYAAARATALLVELCGGTAREGAVDVYPRPWVAPTVALSRERLDTLLGFHVATDEVVRGLTALGFECETDGATFTVRPPWWRTDIGIPDDVAEEEIGRAHV